MNLPAGLHRKKKFYSAEEVAENDKIATARVRVERAIGIYVKKYCIPDKRIIDRKILPYIKDIFEVCQSSSRLKLKTYLDRQKKQMVPDRRCA